MPFQKGNKKPENSGRKKGVPNKTTMAARVALVESFVAMGGINELTKWGKKNQTEFYKIWSKIIPTEIKASGAAVGTVTLAALLAEAAKILSEKNEPKQSS